MNLGGEYDAEVTAFYRKWLGRVQGFLINMGCERGLAEEIADDAFIASRRYWAHVRGLDEPEGYVFKVARRERSKRQKQHDERARDLHPEPAGTLQDVDDSTADIADRETVRQALQQLPLRQREAVIFRDVMDLSEAQTAEIMEVGVGSVKRYTSEGRQGLRLLLADFRPRTGGKS